jgi:methylated-DNA-[protein]-cysteine S-methyltransferase
VNESVFIAGLLGGITLQASAKGLRAIRFGDRTEPDEPGPVVLAAAQQLHEYFAGTRHRFDVPLDLIGTPFQLEVWRVLTQIPYARTASYRDIALAVDRPKGAQAIGQANTRNPIPIIVPCHRVVNADGSLGGYGGGMNRKMELLQLERQYAQRFRETAA